MSSIKAGAALLGRDRQAWVRRTGADGDVICEACDKAEPPPIADLEPISAEALRELLKPRH